MRKYLKKYTYLILIAGIIILALLKITVHAAEDGLTEAKNGIVEVLSGFTDSKGKFFCVKTSSGFLIDNTEGETYLLTTNHCVVVTEEEKSDYCAEHELKVDLTNVQNKVEIIVKGDVTSEASVVAQSAESDYCILRTSNVISEKIPLKFGNSEELTTGTKVYAMGFEEDAEADGAEFTAIDVSVREGNIQNLESNQGGVIYQQHSIKITEGNSGGPLLDIEGYVVGMNNSVKSRPEEGIYFSLPINEIREVLDNYNIDYYSIEKATAEKALDILYTEGGKKYESGDYKKKSLVDLENAMQQVEELKKQQEISEEDIESVSVNLEAAIKNLQEKMPVKEKAMLGLAGIIFLLLFYFFRILYMYRKEKKFSERRDDVGISGQGFGESAFNEQTLETSFWNEKDSKRNVPETDMLFTDKTTMLEDGNNSYLEKNKTAVLVRVKTSESFEIAKQTVNIGKSQQKADIFIEGNPAVSRLHAQIICNNQNYYIQDLGAANGTFLNGERISSDDPQILRHEDKIKLANEEFVFKEL